MKLRRTYNIVINGIIYATSTSFKLISDQFAEIRKTEPTAWIQTCYA